jgi:hypothetical protein
VSALEGCGEHPRSGGQLRWDVDDLFAVSQKPDRDVLADPAQPSIAQTRSGHRPA